MLAIFIYFIGFAFTCILTGVYHIIYSSINHPTSAEEETLIIMNFIVPLLWPIGLLIVLFYIPTRQISDWAKDHEELIREKDKWGLFK